MTVNRNVSGALSIYVQSNHHRTVNNNYHNAKRYSNYALGLVIANIIYTLLLGVILTGVAVGISGIPLYSTYYRGYG